MASMSPYIIPLNWGADCLLFVILYGVDKYGSPVYAAGHQKKSRI